MIRGPAGFSPAAGEKEIEFCPDQEQESASEPQNGWAAPNLRPLRAPRGTAGGKNEDDHDNDANSDGDDDMNNPLSPPTPAQRSPRCGRTLPPCGHGPQEPQRKSHPFTPRLVPSGSFRGRKRPPGAEKHREFPPLPTKCHGNTRGCGCGAA